MSVKNVVRGLLTRGLRSRKPAPIRARGSGFGRGMELLEDRVNPAVTVNFSLGVLTFTSDAAGDIVQIQATGNPADLLYNSGGIGLASVTGVTQVIYNGNGGND